MPTTSNFGWTTPADTDLVKDGALAIRTLGNGIDTSLVDLKGGTTGQILSKASNTDLDFTFINPSAATLVGCSVIKITTAQTLATGTATVITFNSEEFDTNGFHDNVTNNSRITIPSGKGGKYLFVAQVQIAANATGYRSLGFFKNGATVADTNQQGPSPTLSSRLNASLVVEAVAGDYFEVIAAQNSGGNLDVNFGAANTRFCAIYLGA